MPKSVLIQDSNEEAGRIAAIDPANYLVAIDVAHHKAHEGALFFVNDVDDDVDIAAPKYWHFITPNTDKRVHFAASMSADNSGLVELFENPTTTGNGTTITPINADRNSGNTATFLAFYDPTVGADGTLLMSRFIGSSQPATRVGGESRTDSEVILKKNEQYFVKFTVDNDNTKVALTVTFYEEDAYS